MKTLELKNRIKEVINTVKNSGETVTVEAVINASLFSKGGTLAEFENEIIEEFEEIQNRLHAKGREYEKTCQGSFIKGLAGGIMVNKYFNYN